MPDAYDTTGFGDYLTADPDLLAKYREQLRQLGEPNSALADLEADIKAIAALCAYPGNTGASP